MGEVSQLPSGAVLDGRYRIDELLSVGGMGAVYSGVHTQLNKRVALKVLRSDLPTHLMIDRFRREAVAASSIGHPNIVKVNDMAVTRDGIAYLVMELLVGRDLSDAIESEAPMMLERACSITCDVLRGLGAAHQTGIVHRDIKPDNVFLAQKGTREVVKILDFGVSLLQRPDTPNQRLTSTGAVLGTPRYMSPEQARGDVDLSGAADLYATGVVLYEMLTGQLPYVGTNYNVVIHQIIAGEWIPIEHRRPDCPEPLASVVHRALAPSPEDRFLSAEHMIQEIEVALEKAKSAPRRVSAAPGTMPASPAALRITPDPGSPTVELKPSGAPAPSAAAGKPPPASKVKANASWSAMPAIAADGDEPAWAGGAQPKPKQAPRGQFERDAHEIEDERSRGGHGLAIAIGLAALVVVVVFLVLNSGGDDEVASAVADAGTEVASVDAAAKPPSKAKKSKAEVSSTPGAKAGTKKAEPEPKPEPKSEPNGESKPEPKSEPNGESKSEPKSTPDAAKKDKPAPPKDKPEPAKKVNISFLVVPPSAKVSVNGKRISGKRLRVKQSSKALSVKIEADGYMTRRLRVVPEKTREIVVELIRTDEE